MSTPAHSQSIAIPRSVLKKLRQDIPREWWTTSTTEMVRRYLEWAHRVCLLGVEIPSDLDTMPMRPQTRRKPPDPTLKTEMPVLHAPDDESVVMYPECPS